MKHSDDDTSIPGVRVNAPRFRIGLVWIVPVLAICLSLGLGIKALLERGPEVLVQFVRAEGLEANKTRVKYKDVDIGTVKEIMLSENRQAVLVRIQLNRDASDLLAEDSRFWVVRPRVTVAGVTGLATLLSGVHIAIDPGQSDTHARKFVGLEEPPTITNETRGHAFRLSSDTLGSLDIGAPVYYRRIQVGRVIGYGMQEDGRGVDVQVFIDAPYDRFVVPQSRFWHASGVDVAMDADGIRFNMQSVASLVVGGIAFSSPEREGEGEDAAESVPAATVFTLHADQASAQRVRDTEFLKYVLVFKESVRGLSEGAPVDFRGIVAGEVSRIELDFDKSTTDFSLAVEVKLYPERLTRRTRNLSARDGTKKEMREVLDAMVARGFRAQLRTGNVISGQRYVALDYFPRTQAAKIRWDRRIPELPTQPGSLDSLQDQLVNIATMLQQTLQHADGLISKLDKEVAPEFNETMRSARGTLEQARTLMANDAPLQQEIRDALREVTRAARSVHDLADLLERQPEALLKGKKDQ